MVGARTPGRRGSLPSDEEILDAVVDDLLAHGPLEWSLREGGERIGVSARMLIHRFGSRDEVIRLAFDRLHERHASGWLDSSTPWQLDELVSSGHRPVVRFMIQVGAMAFRHQGAYLDLWTATIEDWVERIASLLESADFPPDVARLRARTFIDASRGVQLDVALGGDEEFGVEALNLLADRLFTL
ncbi:MAG: TetR/AcrR family transcriptional regulator [Actinomycetota bacterium]